MSKRRKLTADEMHRIRSYVSARGYGRNPTARVQIYICDELDDEGRYYVRSTSMSEIKAREGEEPWKPR